MAPLRKSYSVILTHIFKVKIVTMLFQQICLHLHSTTVELLLLYMPSNDTTANVVLCDLHIRFQDKMKW